ncbi:guanine nucleotide-binding protein subunit gamma 1 [Gossypium australe]|uniref:Guanine nucleotide-binding protein subunit gamma 1 n=1 Tax=Gossypium australe TaxID=47621 RepID=A0A5B6VPP6_9ROSI|nr:guanine nucleotide-binding protein subunit gamma 1 [Gossypium australe]
MESETASSADEQQAAGSAADTRGKHRILAQLKRVCSLLFGNAVKNFDLVYLADMRCSSVYTDAWEVYLGGGRSSVSILLWRLYLWKVLNIVCHWFIDTEMEELEKTDNVSTLCKELLLSMETRPDPLLPLTNGPINPSWDVWFEGPQTSQGCRCQIL